MAETKMRDNAPRKLLSKSVAERSNGRNSTTHLNLDQNHDLYLVDRRSNKN